MKKNRTSKIVLLVIAITLIVFTAVNLWLFYRCAAVPDTLITAVFAACLGEFGFLAWIRNTKQKYRDEPEIEEDFTEEV